MQFKDTDNKVINVRHGKCYQGLPVNRMSAEDLAAIGLSVYVPEVQEYVHTLEDRVGSIDQACRSAIDAVAHFTSLTVVTEKKGQGKPKATALSDWVDACWQQYFTNKALLQADLANWDDGMTTYPVCPTSMGEVFAE